MRNPGELERENEALRDRLSRLSEASLRINESLDFEGILQEVVDSARAITDARFGGLTTIDGSEQVQDAATVTLLASLLPVTPNFLRRGPSAGSPSHISKTVPTVRTGPPERTRTT